jgi:hypothetical protein
MAENPARKSCGRRLKNRCHLQDLRYNLRLRHDCGFFILEGFSMLSRFCVLLGALYAVAPLSAHSQSPESPERVAKNYVKTVSEGRFGEALLKYGSNASIELMAEGFLFIKNKKMARPTVECLFVRQCTQEEWETVLKTGGAPEQPLLKNEWHEFENWVQARRKGMSGGVSSELQKKGGLVSISATLVSQKANTAQVRLEMKYGDGSTDSNVETLVKESGEWKIQFK